MKRDHKSGQFFSADVFPEAFPILISYFYWWRCGTWNSLEVSHPLVPNLEVVQIQLQAFAKPHNFKPHIFQLKMDQWNNAKKPFLTFETLYQQFSTLLRNIWRITFLGYNEFDQRTRFRMKLRKISRELNEADTGWEIQFSCPLWNLDLILQFQFNPTKKSP